MCKFYPKLNRDLVVAGIFLHDLAKTWELSYENAFSYTDGGQLVGHIVKGAIWVEKKAQDAEKILGEPIPPALINVVQHIILSHHGEPEFGAARIPSTPEAIAVHVIENLDAKLMPALGMTREEWARCRSRIGRTGRNRSTADCIGRMLRRRMWRRMIRIRGMCRRRLSSHVSSRPPVAGNSPPAAQATAEDENHQPAV